MDVRIVSNCDGGRYYPIYGELVLQVSEGANRLGQFVSKKCHIFNIGFNERYEILSSYRKYNFIKVINCDYDSKDLYFASCNELKKPGMMNLSVHRYSVVTGKSDIIYSYNDEISAYYDNKRVKIYILNDNYFLIQTSYKRYDEYENDLGFIDISLELYDVKEDTKRKIGMPYLEEYGIDKIIPIQGNTCIIKTGYSLMTGNRHDLIKPEDRPVEHIGFININQFISDILLNKKDFYFEQIEKFEKNITYPYIRLEDDYIIYSKVNYVEHNETVVYYNLKDKTLSSYKNKDVYRKSDLLETYLIDNEVYGLKRMEDSYEFVDLKSKKNTHIITGCEIVKIMHGLIVTQRMVPKRLFRKPYEAVEIYRGFMDDPVISEKGHVVDVIYTGKDNLYIFTKES